MSYHFNLLGSTFGTGWSSLFGNGANFVSGRGGANGNGGVLRMSVGIGSFPFGLFATTFNFGGFGFGSGSGGGSSVGLAGSGSSGASGTAGGGVVGAAGQSANGFAGFQPLGDDLLLNNSDAERMNGITIVEGIRFINVFLGGRYLLREAFPFQPTLDASSSF
ncbi:unnamed protein product [Protopolystoma xenopodis]|uniref:Uncharacterized protein n=1 Tax=Protopolystoma xenopodis TaxID=117903 RepID=A0A3S5FBS8_9PLAT|nr:unnamed protein product [Protopolystoma xenopodis]